MKKYFVKASNQAEQGFKAVQHAGGQGVIETWDWREERASEFPTRQRPAAIYGATGHAQPSATCISPWELQFLLRPPT